MQLADALVAIAGEPGQTVGRYDLTPSEVALLRAIHGDDAVTQIEIKGEVARSSRAELSRLFERYGSAKNDDNKLIVTTLFPGIGARAFERFDELDLDESFFVNSQPTPKAAEKKRGRPPKKAAPVDEPELPLEDDADPDPFEEMDDTNNELMG